MASISWFYHQLPTGPSWCRSDGAVVVRDARADVTLLSVPVPANAVARGMSFSEDGRTLRVRLLRAEARYFPHETCQIMTLRL